MITEILKEAFIGSIIALGRRQQQLDKYKDLYMDIHGKSLDEVSMPKAFSLGKYLPLMAVDILPVVGTAASLGLAAEYDAPMVEALDRLLAESGRTVPSAI